MNNHPNGTIFQSPQMFELFQNTEKFEPLVLGALDENGQVRGVLLGVFIHEKNGIGRLLSCRFVIYGGPLLSEDEEQKKAYLDLLLIELVKQTRRKALFIQLRNYFSWEGYLDIFEKHGFTFLDRLNFIIRLPATGYRKPERNNLEIVNETPETSDEQPATDPSTSALLRCSSTRRRQIRKGLESGAEIIEPENIGQVREFYDILYKLYRYKVRKPLAHWSFFESFYNLSQAPDPRPQAPIGIIRLIRYEDKIIGGILAPLFANKCIYEWYVCGLDKEYKEQYPSVLATWAAIEYAAQNNIANFDFMGVGRPGIPYGVRDFKARFGGEEVNYGRLTRINNKFLYHVAELGYNVLALLKKI